MATRRSVLPGHGLIFGAFRSGYSLAELSVNCVCVSVC